MRYREVVRLLRHDGWYEDRQRGSHVQFKHDAKPGLVSVPRSNKDLSPGVIGSIERQSGVDLRRRER